MKYVTTAVLTFGAGAVLGLSKSQAAPRAAVLAAVPDRDGWYRAAGQVQFKRGEAFEYEGELPKSIADALDYEGKQAPVEASAKPRARAKAKTDPKELA